MYKMSPEAQATYDKLGKLKVPQAYKKFEGLPVLGPYKYWDGTYLGQFKDGKPHGFGTFVSFFSKMIFAFVEQLKRNALEF